MLDFGPGLVGERITRTIVVRNDGRGDFRIDAILTEPGFSEAFQFRFEPLVLGVGESRELAFAFEPAEQGDFEGTLSLQVSNASVETFQLKLKGRGVRGGCVIEPAELADFGAVATGTSFVLPIAIRNQSDLDWKVTVGGISSQSDEGAFAFRDFEPGEYEVPAHDALVVPVEFRPNHVGQHSAFLEIPAPAMCNLAVMPLIGNGVNQVLVWEPQEVDFGYVNPGKKARSSVTFRNLGNLDVKVDGLAIANDTRQQFSLETSVDGFVVPRGGGEVEVSLGFKASTLLKQLAKLSFTTDDSKLPTGFVNLNGYGGGPDLDVKPKLVDFGEVGVGTWQFRRVVLANVGTDVQATQDDNLLLAVKGADGRFAQKMPTIVSTPPGAFVLELPLQGYPSAGLQANTTAELLVKFQPQAVGAAEARITLYSNDPEKPEVEVTVLGEGRNLPPCDYEIVPSQVRFGNVESTRRKDMQFSIRNRGVSPSEICVVSNLALASGSDRSYSLPQGELHNVTIAAGESLNVPVRFAPTAVERPNVEGTVLFYVNSPTAPEARVKLQGSSMPACLMIAPEDLDFGVIEINCSSRERTFSVYNLCPGPVTITGIDVQAGISNEFRVTQRPIFPADVAEGASVDFKAVYRPTDLGPDQGSIAVQTAQLAQPYVVTLAGRGDTTAIQTDVFAQDPEPKVDVLFVVDDSCSMDVHQGKVGANFDRFIQFAIAQQIDFRIAVTTTTVSTGSNSSKGPNGEFVPRTPAVNRVISNRTPNAAAVFAANVKVGTSGSGTEKILEAAYLALSSANLQGHNAGFLRDDAHLAIVAVTDAADQSLGQAVSFYYNFFLNLKGFRRASDFTFSGIIPVNPTEVCEYDETTAGRDPRLKEIIARSGGVMGDICDPDFAATLEKLGERAFGSKTRFFMTGVPDMTVVPNPITVEINGVNYPAAGHAGDPRWVYNPNVNAIDFDPLAIPEPGSTVKITYKVQCLP